MKSPSIHPGAAGFLMPAEWARQDAVWFTWPPNGRIWPKRGPEIAAKFAEIIALASRFQNVRVNAAASLQPSVWQALRDHAAELSAVTLYDHPADDVWCRDHGALFLRHPRTGEVAVTDWVFNGWGGKFQPCEQDTALPARMAQALGLRSFSYDRVLEGGALEADGAGVIMTTAAVLLNSNRGGHDKTFWENLLEAAVGAHEIIWLGEGLPRDDTDGHIDNLARFLPDGSVLCVAPGRHCALRHNRVLLEDRFPGRVRELPLPNTAGPPLSYANYVVLNGAVLVPAFDQPRLDDQAAGILRDAFPDREIHAVDCRLLLEEGGALHCLSMNQPA